MPLDINSVVLPPIPDPKPALLSILPELAAMTPERIQRHITIDVGVAGRTVIGNLRDITRVELELVAIYGDAARRRIARLPTLAMAAVQAQADYAAAREHRDLSDKGQVVAAFQGRLYAHALSLAYEGYLDREAVDARKGGMGYKAQYEAVLGLADLMRDGWSGIVGKTPATLELLDAATAAAKQLVIAVGARDEEDAVNAATEQRVRVYSLLSEEYEEVRRMVDYLRHHEGDAEVFAPSLVAAARRGNATKKEDGGEYPPEPSTPTPSPVVTGDPTDDGKDVDPSDPFVS